MFENKTRDLTKTIQITAPLKCHLEEHTWHKMMGWCKAAKSEVSGMGLVKIVNNVFVVYEVFFPKQYCSSGYTELDDRANAKLQIALYNKKIPANHYRFWWHTHYNFNTFWSGTDDGNATTLAKANGEWELSLVINQSGDFLCRADFFKKIHPLVEEKVHVLIDNIEVLTCKNSKRYRHKPNFKSDVKRFVLPMSDLPDSQKPKLDQTSLIHMPGHGHEFSGMADEYGYAGEYGNWWGYGDDKGEYWDSDKKEWKKRADKTAIHNMQFFNGKTGKWEDRVEENVERCKKCDSRFCQDGYICKKKYLVKTLAQTKIDETKKDKTDIRKLKNGDNFGEYIYLDGLLVSKWQYDIETLKKESADSKSPDAPDKPETPCPCGDERCVKQELCVHCDLCQGRCQAATGYCPGCYEFYVNQNKGVSTIHALPESTTVA